MMFQYKKNETGKKFGRLTVVERTVINKRGYFVCECECGSICTVRTDQAKSGRTVSCGCYNKERAKRGDNRRVHGKHGTRLYRIWLQMRTRCTNEHTEAYKNYGARGVFVCEEWNNFDVFYEWAMANGYADNLTIDRIDNNGAYEPSNCRWVTRKVQANNTRHNHFVEYNGERRTVAEWSEIVGLSPKIILWRLNNGWSIEKTLTTPHK